MSELEDGASMSIRGQILTNWQKKQRELFYCCSLHHPICVIILSCIVIWIEMVCGVVGICAYSC
jgi:hypothetical protein